MLCNSAIKIIYYSKHTPSLLARQFYEQKSFCKQSHHIEIKTYNIPSSCRVCRNKKHKCIHFAEFLTLSNCFRFYSDIFYIFLKNYVRCVNKFKKKFSTILSNWSENMISSLRLSNVEYYASGNLLIFWLANTWRILYLLAFPWKF